jgi:hypothetical protein
LFINFLLKISLERWEIANRNKMPNSGRTLTLLNITGKWGKSVRTMLTMDLISKDPQVQAASVNQNRNPSNKCRGKMPFTNHQLIS